MQNKLCSVFCKMYSIKVCPCLNNIFLLFNYNKIFVKLVKPLVGTIP